MTGRRIVVSLLFAYLFVFGVPDPVSAAPFRLFSPGDPVIEDLRLVSREAGRSLLSLTPPFSGAEVAAALKDIETDALSPSGRDAYRRIRSALDAGPAFADGPIRFSAGAALSLEGRARTDSGIAWTRDEGDSRSFLNAPLEFFFGDNAYAAGDLDVRADPTFYEKGTDLVGTNVPFAAERIDLNVPLRAFLAAGGDWWTFQLGRDKLDFGSGLTGNLAISDDPDYHDFARLSLFSPNFKYSLLVSQLPLSVNDLCADGYGPFAGGAGTDPALDSTTQRYLYYHRWDVRLFGRVSVGLGEGALVGNSAPELRFLNPLTIYHSFFAWEDYDAWKSESGAEGDMVGSLMNLEFEWAVFPSFALYGQAVMNQFATSYEKEKWPEDGSPNGLGFLAGAEYATDFSGTSASFALEAVYADPYLYTLSSPFSSYIWMRRLSELSDKDPRYAWIGHPEGRDFLLFALRGRFVRPRYALTLKASYKLQGEHGLSWDWARGPDSASQSTPSGVPERRALVSADLDWKATKKLAVGAYLAVIRVDGADHVKGDYEMGAETALSVTYTF